MKKRDCAEEMEDVPDKSRGLVSRFLLRDVRWRAITGCEVALPQLPHFSVITMKINLHAYQKQAFSEFIYCFPVAGKFPNLMKMCTYSISYASVIWEPSDKRKLEKCMVKASFIKAKIITQQWALRDLKYNFHLLQILHFSPLSLSVPGLPHLGTIIRLISR